MMTECYIYVGEADDSETGEGITGGTVPGLGSVQLVAQFKRVADKLRPTAQLAADLVGKPVRLVRFTRAEVIETITPRPRG